MVVELFPVASWGQLQISNCLPRKNLRLHKITQQENYDVLEELVNYEHWKGKFSHD